MSVIPRVCSAFVSVFLFAFTMPPGILAADTQPPDMVDFDFHPKEVDTSGGAQDITITASMTDDTGFEYALFIFASPTSNQFLQASLSADERTSGTATDGFYQTPLTIESYAEEGTWSLVQIFLQDISENTTNISGQALLDYCAVREFPRQFSVIPGEEDDGPPNLVGLTFSTNRVDVGDGAQTVVVEAHIQDDLSGFSYAAIRLAGPPVGNDPPTSSTHFVVFDASNLFEGTITDGHCRADLVFPLDSEPGLWTIDYIQLIDHAGNEMLATGADALDYCWFWSLPYEITVESNPTPKPPELTYFSLTPQQLTVPQTPATIAVTARIETVQGEFEVAYIGLQRQMGGQPELYVTIRPDDLIAGDGSNGLYAGTLDIYEHTKPATWFVGNLSISDTQGGNLEIWENEAVTYFTARTLPHTINILSDIPDTDTEPPHVEFLLLFPRTVNVSDAEATIAVRANLTDDSSGVDFARLVFASPSGNQSASVSYSYWNRADGSITNGAYRADLTIQQFAETGTWTIASIDLFDLAGNHRELLGQDAVDYFAEREFLYTFSVESDDAPDIEPPELVALSILPRTLVIAGDASLLVVTSRVTDARSGVASGTITFSSPSEEQTLTVDLSESTRISGDQFDGLYRAELHVWSESEIGLWHVSAIELVDQALNVLSLTDEEALDYFANRELDSSFTLVAAASAPSLVAFDFDPKFVNTAAGAQQVELTAQITDQTGFTHALFMFESPSGEQVQLPTLSEENRTSGNATDGIYSTTMTVASYSEAGTWTLTMISLLNDQEHTINFEGENLVDLCEEREFPMTFTVVAGQPDQTPPVLAGLLFSTNRVDVGDGAQLVELDAHITDDLSGLQLAEVRLASPGLDRPVAYTDYVVFSADNLIEGSLNDGHYQADLFVPQGAETGIWTIGHIRLVDNVGNELLLTDDAARQYCIDRELDHEITVISNPTLFPPELSEFYLTPWQLPVSQTPANIAVTARIETVQGEFERAEVRYQRQTAGDPAWANAVILPADLIEGDSTNGLYAVTLQLPAHDEPALWTVASVSLLDSAGGQLEITGNEAVTYFTSRSMSDTISVLSDDPDTEAPHIDGLEFSPAGVNVAASAQDIVATATITDDSSGVNLARLMFASPSGNQNAAVAFASWNRISGDFVHGIYRESFTIQQHAEPGTWTLASIELFDLAGNERELLGEAAVAYCLERGLFYTFTVESEQPDLKPPVIAELTITPPALVTSGDTDFIVVTARVTDARSGVGSGSITFSSPSGEQSLTVEISETTRVSGDRFDGVYASELGVWEGTERGRWRVSSLEVSDQAFNTLLLEDAAARDYLETRNLDRQFTIVDPDEAFPSIVSLTVNPGLLATPSLPRGITVTARVTDSLSGLEGDGSVVFRSPTGSQTHTFAIDEASRMFGDAIDGIYQTSLAITPDSEPGSWRIDAITLSNNENTLDLAGADAQDYCVSRGLARGFHLVEPFDLDEISKTGSELTFRWLSLEGARYVLEYSENLLQPTWHFKHEYTGTGGVMSVQVPVSADVSALRIYRIRALPED